MKNCNRSKCDDSFKDTRENCHNCKVLRASLHKRYHKCGRELKQAFKDNNNNNTTVTKLAELAAAELEARLLYDYVFSMVTEEDIKNGDWMMLKDHGHKAQYRMLYTWSRMGKKVSLMDILESCQARRAYPKV